MYPLVAALQSNSQSKANFCRAHQLNIHAFTYWLQKYRIEKQAATSREANTHFIALQVSPSIETGVELCYPNGVRLSITGEASLSYLLSLIQLTV